jgi:hypothetical protein
MLENKFNRVESALYNPSSAALFELLELEYQNRKNISPFCMSASHGKNTLGPVYAGTDDTWKASLHVGFVKHCLDQINLADMKGGRTGKKGLEDAYHLLVSGEARSASNLWGPHELQDLGYGRVRPLILIQISVFMMIIGAQHAGFTYIEKGNSGFYKCINHYKRRSYGKDYDMSTEDAQREVEIILGKLEAKGY